MSLNLLDVFKTFYVPILDFVLSGIIDSQKKKQIQFTHSCRSSQLP